MPDIAAREKAKKLINDLAGENGWLSEDDRQYMSHRPSALKTFDKLRVIAASSTKSLSDNLYQKNTRFVYELIQNADDNSYENGVVPSLSFALFQDRIVIESNEKGFSEANVRAICNVGKSTKTGVYGYIGEKGIGFKSVFKVAKRVHVQSEPYSFAFDYNHNLPDGGLGMVTPIPEEYSGLRDGIRTRMELSLRSDCNRRELFREFNSLPDTFLIFLRKLKKLELRIEGPDGTMTTVYTKVTEKNRVKIKKTVSGVEDRFLYFWVDRKLVEDMPKDDKRVIKKEGEEDQLITKAEIVLALQLNKDDVPIIEPQHVFAFLPLRKVGFNFLIQSDFITQANREDISDTPWNRRIFSEVATLFVNLVKDLLDHPTLRYQWVRYLTVDAIPDDFWGELQRTLIQNLKDMNLFVNCHEEQIFYHEARIVPKSLRDDAGKNPLLPDCNCKSCLNGSYLAEKYNWDLDVPVLQKFGFQELSSEEFVHRLHVDLRRDNALMWSKHADDKWYTQIAEVLLKMMSNEARGQKLADQIRLLPLVPLIGKKPAPTRGPSIYLPSCGGIDVPHDLPLGLVEPSALKNKARARLFHKLGVTECGPEKVIGLIEDASKMTGGRAISLEQSVEHIQFLFWHHNKIPSPTPTIHLFDIHSQQFNPNLAANGWTYWSLSDQYYSLYRILDPENKPDELQGTARFLNPAYLPALSNLGDRHNTSPLRWITTFFHVKLTTSLTDRGRSSQPSPEINWLVKKNSGYLLGTINAGWDDMRRLKSIGVKFNFSKTCVPIINSERDKALCDSYLPIPKLMEIVSELGLERDFGFVSELIGESDWNKWKEFHQFGIGMEEDLGFWTHILKKARTTTGIGVAKMGKIYSNLQRMCRTDDDKAKVRETFSQTDSKYIFIPRADNTSSPWFALEGCLWDGPSWYSCRPLVSKTSEYAGLYHFFSTVLGLQNAGRDHYLDDLASLRGTESLSSGISIAEVTKNLYKELLSITNIDASAAIRDGIRTCFETKNLVYDATKKTWLAPTDCIWAKESIEIPGKFSMQDQYGSLKSFFTRVLKVEAPSLKLHVNGLKEVASLSPTFEDIRQRIRNICQLGPAKEDLKDLVDCRCFPVNGANGRLVWMSSKDDFAIPDRKEYLKLFMGRIAILSFSLEEVHEFNSFLMGLHLGIRYLSKLVTLNTSAEGDEKNESLTADLSRKAYAICRFAAHHKSLSARGDTKETFQRLRNLYVFKTDNIHRELIVHQNKKIVTAQAETAYCHLKTVEDTKQLEIYVPKRRKDLDICLATHLPLAMVEYLGVRETNIGQFSSIISASSLAVVDAIIDSAGIINLVGVERPEDDDDEASEADDDEQPAPQATSPGVKTGTPPSTSPAPHVHVPPADGRHSRWWSADDFGRSPSSASSSLPSFISTPATSISDSLTPQDQSQLYKKLLMAVVGAAGSLAAVPTCGLTRTARSFASPLSPSDVDSAVRSSNRKELIGAAGELFIFEWLKSLKLPHLERSNWQSRIRGHVRSHPSYHDLQNWPGRETSDIIYDDTDSVLTHLLINHGYLSSRYWNDKKPKYYIEVKATTSVWTTHFFVTQNQVDLMENKILPEEGTADAVYLIARAFNLGQAGMGLRLYVDPASLRRQGRLVFRSDQYEVLPGFVFGT